MDSLNPFAPKTAVQRPAEVAELAEVVRVAGAEQRALNIRGGRTHERFQNLGDPPDLIVDLTGLKRAIEYSPVDLTLAVEAGMPLATLDALLADQGQRLALDMPHRDRATIGGVFASGLSGPRRLRYGALKDMVIGAEVVNNRGQVAKSGGMVVKNVSGYELARLHYGAHGAFGVVSRLNLKVLPAVERRVEACLTFSEAAAACSAGAAVLVSTLDPAAVYLTGTDDDSWTLRVQLEGASAFVARQAAAVIESAPEAEAAGAAELAGASTPEFDTLADLADGHVAVARLSVPASRQAGVLERLCDLKRASVLADMGSGLIYVRGRFEATWTETFDTLGFPVAFLALSEEDRQDRDVFGRMDGHGLEVVRRLKDQFDPTRIFNPGRFVSFL